MKDKNLTICTWNVCLGVKYKKVIIKNFLQKQKIDILAIQEAEIDEKEDLSVYNIPGFNAEFDNSSPNIRTLMYINSSIEYTRNRNREEKNLNIIMITVHLSKSKINISSVYRTFKLNSQASYLEVFKSQLNCLKNNINTKDVNIIIGDFNIDYKRKVEASYNNHRLCEELEEFETQHGLTQQVNEVTWSRVIRGRIKTSTLDHIYINDPTKVNSITYGSVSVGDHRPVILKIGQTWRCEVKKHLVRNWKCYSKELLLEEMSKVDWQINCYNVQDFNDELEQKIMTVIDKIVPFEEKKVKNGRFMEPRFLSEMKRKRKNLFKNAVRRRSKKIMERCKGLDLKIRKLDKLEERRTVRKKILKGDQKSLWEGLKIAQDKSSSSYPRKMVIEGREVSTNQEKADSFASHLINKLDGIRKDCKIDAHVFNGSKLFEEENENFFTPEKVESEINNLKNKTCYGMDRIPVIIIRDASMYLKGPITLLLNKIYDQKFIPEQWKTSRIIPLYKKGNKQDLSNYRPIHNLCALSKLFERLMLQRLLDIEQNHGVDITGKGQHGFKKGKSTITACKELQKQISWALDEGNYAGVASLDLSAAFDVVNVDLLLKRIRIMGFPEDIVNLLSCWLTNRLAYAEVDGVCSQYFELESGTCQGSILGPVLFSLFVCPIVNTEDLTAYADDTYQIEIRKVKTEVIRLLEIKLQRVELWYKQSGLKVNVDKTEIVLFHRTDIKSEVVNLNGHLINTKQSMKVLGIIFDSKLEWMLQVESNVISARKTTQALRIVRRYFTCSERIQLLTSLVYSKMYYGSEIWLIPSLKKRILNKLYSQSGFALKLVEPLLTYKQLHKKYKRATPEIYMKYQIALLLYDLMKTNEPDLDFANLHFVCNNEERNENFTFTTNNNTKVGLNCISNRFRTINNAVKKSWLNCERNSFKVKCKETLINNVLLLW